MHFAPVNKLLISNLTVNFECVKLKGVKPLASADLVFRFLRITFVTGKNV